jgi:YVTN family beta-propeller protein
MAVSERSRHSTHIVRLLVAVAVLLVFGAVLGIVGQKAAHKVFHSTTTPTGAEASAGYGLDSPTSAAVVDADLFVANGAGNSLTEVNASTGAHIATVSGAAFGFARPQAIVAVGGDLFVANGTGNSVSEVEAKNRSLVRQIAGAAFEFSDPVALAVHRGDLFVLSASGRVTEIATGTGRLVGVASGARYGFDAPSSIAASSHDLYVTNRGSDTVTKIDAGTLAFVAQLSGPRFGFDEPTGVAIAGSDLWVTNQGTDSATEVSLATDQPVRVVKNSNLATPGPITVGDGYVFTISPPGDSPMVSQITPDNGSVPWMMCNTNGPYLFNNPQSAVVSGSNLWVVNEGSSSLTEMDTDSGALIRTIS